METSPSMMKIKTFKYNSAAQQPIFLNNNNPATHFTQNTNNMIPTDASFSSYLKPESQNHQLKSTSSARVLDDSEISIFDAQKYFNETNTNSEPKRRQSFSPVHDTIPRLSSSDGGGGGYNRARSFHATPTASSEASWNSQTGLLSNPPGGLAVTLRNLPSNSAVNHERRRGDGGSNSTGGTKWFFGRKCPCSGKKSVQVEEIVVLSEPKAPPPKRQINHHQELVQKQEILNHQRLTLSSSMENHFPANGFQRLSGSGRPFSDSPAGGFSFPILNNPSLPPQSSMDDPPRESLEVFQPLDENPATRKTTRGFGFPGSPISRVTATDDDMASDASSDLFEIESFSTNTATYPMYRCRDSLDEVQNFNTRRLSASNIYSNRRSMDEPMTPSVAPTECYEPSEASIDWSVTTAEGFDRSSVTNFSISASEFDDVAMARHACNNGVRCGGVEGGRKKGNGGGGGGLLMMSCRQEKAVSVGPQPVKCVAAAAGGEGQHGGGPGGQLMLPFRHVSSRAPPPRSNNNNKAPPPIARSHSARLSLAFAA